MLGAIIGDICGSSYEYNPARSKEFELLRQNSRFTDDTILTIAVADSFMNNKDLITTIKEHCYKYPKRRGYPQSYRRDKGCSSCCFGNISC